MRRVFLAGIPAIPRDFISRDSQSTRAHCACSPYFSRWKIMPSITRLLRPTNTYTVSSASKPDTNAQRPVLQPSNHGHPLRDAMPVRMKAELPSGRKAPDSTGYRPFGDDFFAPSGADVAVGLARYFPWSPPHPVHKSSADSFISRSKAYVEEALEGFVPDGPDDAVDFLSKVPGGPYMSMGLMGAFFPIVAIAAKSTVKNAAKCYQEEYPASVKLVLDQQRQLIEALRADGASDGDVMYLEELHALGCHTFEERSQHRGIVKRAVHNLHSRGELGNGDVSRMFADEAVDIVELLLARKALSRDSGYQFRKLQRCEDDRHAVKKKRIPNALSGGALTGMATAIPLSIGGSAATAVEEAVHTTAASVAAEALGSASSGVMLPSQLAQGVSGTLSALNGRKARERIHSDREALLSLASNLPPAAAIQYAQIAAFLLRQSARSQIWSTTLAVSQFGMAANTAASFAPSVHVAVTAPLAALFAGGTIAAAVGAGMNQKVLERFTGQGASPALKEALAIENPGRRLRADGSTAPAVADAAADYRRHHRELSEAKLWSDILKVVDQSDILVDAGPHPTSERWRAVCRKNDDRSEKHWLLPEGLRQISDLQRTKYHPGFLQQSAAEIHTALHLEIMKHPMAADAAASPKFQEQLLFNTVGKLAKLEREDMRALFYNLHGRPLSEATMDDLMELVCGNTSAQLVLLKECNKLMTTELIESGKYARYQSHVAMTDLARAESVFAGQRASSSEFRTDGATKAWEHPSYRSRPEPQILTARF